MEYVFFSGGFDSTAFLLECLFVKKVETTPIVVTDPDLDGQKFHCHQDVKSRNLWTATNYKPRHFQH